MTDYMCGSAVLQFMFFQRLALVDRRFGGVEVSCDEDDVRFLQLVGETSTD